MRKSVFLEVFGDNPQMKVLDALIESSMFDLSKAEIARLSKVNRVTLNKIFPVLLKESMIVKSRTVGRATLYKLNKNSPIVQKIIELDIAITKKATDKYLEKEKVPA